MIMGANIGTTVTSLMLSVKLDFGVIFAVVGLIFLLLGGRSSFKMLGQIFIGLGILFVGMETMTDAMAAHARLGRFPHDDHQCVQPVFWA